MKGILIQPGRAPAITALPDTLQGMEKLLGGHVMQYVFPRTPAVLVYSYTGQGVNRFCQDRTLCGPILCYGWRGGDIKPLSGDLANEMLDRLKEFRVRI